MAQDSNLRIGLICDQDQDIPGSARMATEEINSLGGILAHEIELICRETGSNQGPTRQIVFDMIDKEQVNVIIGAVSDNHALEAAKICNSKSVPFFAVSAHSNSLTGTEAGKYSFRECLNSWMAAYSLGTYLHETYPEGRFMYVSNDDIQGMTNESVLRRFSMSNDPEYHSGILVSSGEEDFTDEIKAVVSEAPDVLILNLNHGDLINALNQINDLDLNIQLAVPSLHNQLLKSIEPDVLSGLIGTVAWCPDAAYRHNYPRGIKFVEDFRSVYDSYPSDIDAAIYAVIYEYRAAVERAGGFDVEGIIDQLENHSYTFLKDQQTWRDFDHQSVQSVYVVRCEDRDDWCYPKVIHKIDGDRAVRNREDWNAVRKAHNLTVSHEDR